MMSKKTKAMEQQLNQLAQENDALRAQLAAAGIEIENIKSELAKTVGERDRFRNELNGAQLDLSNAKRRLDDFRLRQEAIVNALTEAHNTRERILKEANANADRIDAEAKQRRRYLKAQKKKRLRRLRMQNGMPPAFAMPRRRMHSRLRTPPLTRQRS